MQNLIVGGVGVDACQAAVLVLAHVGVTDDEGAGWIDAGAVENRAEGQGH